MADDFKDWPADLIAFKWADTLSEAEQSELLASSLRRLQNAINVAARSDLARKVIQTVEAERLHENLDNESDEGYNRALNHVTAALRELFRKEGIEHA